MSTGSPQPLRPRPRLSPAFRAMLLVWLVVVVGAYLLFQFTSQQAAPAGPAMTGGASRPPSPPESLPPPGDARVQAALPKDQPRSPDAPAAPAAAPSQSPEEVAAAKMQWLALKAEIEEVHDALSAAIEDVDRWAALVKELPTSEAGKRIAANKAHVDQYRALLEQSRPAPRRAGQIRDTLDIHLETVQAYLGRPGNTSTPGPTLASDISRLKSEAQALATAYRRDRQALERLLADSAASPPAEATLEQAVKQREQEVAGEYLAQLAAAKAAAEAEAQKKIREAEQEAIRQKAQAEADRLARLGAEEARRLREETEQRLRAIQEEAERKKREEESKRLRALAEDPNVQKKYSALLAKGTLLFDTSPGGACRRSARPMAASFGDLNSHGWLRSVDTFARAMSRQPNPDYNIFNDRPTRAFPKTPAEWQEMEQLFEQFKLLGPIWVEMGLLEP